MILNCNNTACKQYDIDLNGNCKKLLDIQSVTLCAEWEKWRQENCNHAYKIKPDGIGLEDHCYKCGAKR